ncbi:PREDICTED: glycine--tRNA ligase, chloroplastic/mitochondrial 2 isoform X1 [Theobroma cacao]|uniref:Glycine--tRNA ligase, chloroplastic/mitochondrial 2 isoform X1 n=1 Tax=Theobroma cacao TaxID=3641 RepID=A0AB32VYW0_THECC|nr:PREDICTED: glycine--tRNA ligase, chloroplastic/mitochondrial 2 isoform X1 [Theobroma cacao]
MQIGCVSGCRLISPEVLHSVLAECANLSCLGAKTACKVGALRCYSSEVDDAAFETNKERALWDAFFFTKSKIHPGIEVDDFIEISSELVQPLEYFFQSNNCDGGMCLRILNH